MKQYLTIEESKLISEKSLDEIKLQQKNFSINPLSSSAFTLLSLLAGLQNNTSKPKEIEQFRREILNEIKSFEYKAKSLAYSKKIILATSYFLCTALDEKILQWDGDFKEKWQLQTLLNIHHKDTWGGERFFIIIEKMLVDLDENIDCIEVAYLLLSLGFEGMHYKDFYLLREIRENLFLKIQEFRGVVSDELTPPGWKKFDISSRQNFPYKLVFGISAILIFGFSLGFKHYIDQEAFPVIQSLRAVR